jgi:hypothetical protein
MGAKDFSSKPKIHSPPQKIQYVNHEQKMITKKWIMMVFTIGQERNRDTGNDMGQMTQKHCHQPT